MHGPSCEEQVMELVQREAERCDRLDGLMLLQSLAGGTGSGVGAFLTQSLRERYPTSPLVNHVVWPFESGEVIVQHYNCMLTLATVADSADAVFFFENEHLDRQCRQMLKIAQPTLDDMNRTVASQLSQFCLPASLGPDPCGGHGGTVLNFGRDVVRHCCANARYRLVSTRSLPQLPPESIAFEGRARWTPLLSNLRQMLLADAMVDERANWRATQAASASRAAASSSSSPAAAVDQVADQGIGSSVNKSCATMVVVRGDLAPDPAATDFQSLGSPSFSSSSAAVRLSAQPQCDPREGSAPEGATAQVREIRRVPLSVIAAIQRSAWAVDTRTLHCGRAGWWFPHRLCGSSVRRGSTAAGQSRASRWLLRQHL